MAGMSQSERHGSRFPPLDLGPRETLHYGLTDRIARSHIGQPAQYSEAMESSDTEAVYDFWAPEFHSHVTSQVAPDRVGEDVRGEEPTWWNECAQPSPTWSSP